MVDQGRHFIVPFYAQGSKKVYQYNFLLSAAVLRIRIRDPGLGAFLTPGSGIGCLFDPWIRDPGLIWYGLAIPLAYPREEEGNILLVQIISPAFAALRGRGEGSAPCRKGADGARNDKFHKIVHYLNYELAHKKLLAS